MSERKYLVAYVSDDGTISVMGNNKDWDYAKDTCDRHNEHSQKYYGRKPWKIFEIGQEIYPKEFIELKEVFKDGICLTCGDKAGLAPGIGWYCTNPKCKN